MVRKYLLILRHPPGEPGEAGGEERRRPVRGLHLHLGRAPLLPDHGDDLEGQ